MLGILSQGPDIINCGQIRSIQTNRLDAPTTPSDGDRTMAIYDGEKPLRDFIKGNQSV
jgi:hypothetical protein